MKKPKKKPQEAEEWDFSQGMGIMPEEISLTQNIGCVGGRKPKTKELDQNQENKK